MKGFKAISGGGLYENMTSFANNLYFLEICRSFCNYAMFKIYVRLKSHEKCWRI